MIKFFRKIRYDLVEKNKTGKYLKYAIGEIFLVVIGILIALQINNWNQQYKNDQLSDIFLKDFKRDLESDILSLQVRIKTNTDLNSVVDSIFLTLAKKTKLSNKELMKFFDQHSRLAYESYFIPEKTTIRQLEGNNNASLISSKNLKDKLFKYYSVNDRNEMNGEQSLQLYQHHFFTKEITQPMLAGDIIYNLSGVTLSRSNLDLNNLKKNSEYLWSLIGKKNSTNSQNNNYENIKAIAEDLVKMIDLEFE